MYKIGMSGVCKSIYIKKIKNHILYIFYKKIFVQIYTNSKIIEIQQNTNLKWNYFSFPGSFNIAHQ